MNIAQRLQKIRETIPKNVHLIAVSKTKPLDYILEAYHAGQLDFGENKAMELLEKFENSPKDIRWHMIGHLQRNKVKYLAPFVFLIHSVDSERLLSEINKQAEKNNRKINILLQMHIAKEETKYGLSENEIKELLSRTHEFPWIHFKGLMGMATFTEETVVIKSEFSRLNKFFMEMKSKYPALEVLSMGMSNDYLLAIEEGSNMIRVGSAIFGER